MNIGLLKTFLEVAQHRHFSRAADKICLTQSAVSARIKQLEEFLGTPLFTRKRNDIELTNAGRRLAISATQMIKFWEQAVNEINLVSDDEQQLIRIGISFDLWTILFKRWLIARRKRNPKLLFQIMALSLPLLNERLLADELDAIVVFEPPYHSGLEIIELDSLNLVLILVSNKPISMSQVDSLDFYYVDWGAHFSDQYQQLLADKLIPSMSFNISGMALEYLLEEGGLCYLSEIDAQRYIDLGQLYKVKNAPEFNRKINFCYRKSNLNATLLNSLIREG